MDSKGRRLALRYLTEKKALTGLAANHAVRRQARRDFGAAVEPVTLHRSQPRVMAAVWAVLRETLVVCDRVPRRTKEAIATAVSQVNECPYCIDAHDIMQRAAAAGRRPSGGLLDVEWGARFGQATATRETAAELLPGLLAPALFPAGGTRADVARAEAARAEVWGTAFAFHYINRVVAVFLGESPLPTTLPVLGSISRAASAVYFAIAMRREHLAGESLFLLDPADAEDIHLPDDLAWATPAPHIEGAIAGLVSAVESAGNTVLSQAAQATITDQLTRWDGTPPPIDRTWLETTVTQLEEPDRPATTIALLTARAPYRITPSDISNFREHHPGDANLIAAVSWGALTAARQIPTWNPQRTQTDNEHPKPPPPTPLS